MKNRFYLMLISILMLNKIDAFSQAAVDRKRYNLIYLEFLGAGGYGTINYERIFQINNHLLFSTRIGLSTYNIKDYTNNINPDMIIPLTLNASYGKNHKIEIGYGKTFSSIVYAKLTNFEPGRSFNTHTNFHIGYRYQRSNAGLMYRISYSPIIEFNKYYRHRPGISVGYAF
jgi:hypothetical protein